MQPDWVCSKSVIKNLKVIPRWALTALFKLLVQTFIPSTMCSSSRLTCLLLYMGMQRFSWNVLECVCVRVKDSECVSVVHQSGIPGLGKLNVDPKPNNSWPHLLALFLLHPLPPPTSDIGNRVFPETKDGRNGGECVGDGGLPLISFALTISLDTAAEIFSKLPNVLIDRRYCTLWKVSVAWELRK